jgi:hypothetical protein
LNVFIGNESGYSFTGEDDGEENIFIGNRAGGNVITSSGSIFIGTRSGLNVSSLTSQNTFVGDRTGANGNPNSQNTFIGASAGFHSSGETNTYIGVYAGNANYTGNNNTFLGSEAGAHSTGSNNVFIGFEAGDYETQSEKLHIANNGTTSLIYGDFASGSEMVQVNGDFHATGAITSDVKYQDIPDYVFDEDYKLETIEEHAEFMWNNKHLPAVKSAKEIEAEGKIDMNERREQLLEELEKAHIYIEQLNNEVKSIKEENEVLKQKLNEIIELLEK